MSVHTPVSSAGQIVPGSAVAHGNPAMSGMSQMVQSPQNNLNNLRPKSWHWIKSNINKEELFHVFYDHLQELNKPENKNMFIIEDIVYYKNNQYINR